MSVASSAAGLSPIVESATVPAMDADDLQELFQKCQRVAAHYQSKFPSVTPLPSSSPLLLELLQGAPTAAPIFVDVRTAAERAVSGIAGAVTLSELEMDPREDAVVHAQLSWLPESPVIVVYCTIGYRSGMEAQRLQQRHPHWRIYNLDGIVAYAHAWMQAATTATSPQQSPDKNAATLLLPPIVHPETGEPVYRIHTFGKAWDYLHPQQQQQPSHFQSIHFGRIAIVGRTLQVGGRVVVCSTQSLVYHCRSCCHCRRRRRPNGCGGESSNNK